MTTCRTIAFYLPQFHPIPENDTWWGRGFTEWVNVTAARPLFSGHHQPRLPADLGFYDLRVEDVAVQQAELAREAGLYGFCYYHYWFAGTELLDMPLRRMLGTGTPDLPFMVCWANENWSRLWNGGDKDVLIGQAYSADDDVAHIRRLLPVLADPRYITVQGAAALAIYRIDELPEPERTADRWRAEAAREGLDLHLCAVESSRVLFDAVPAGFDAVIQFLPQRPYLGPRIGFGRVEARLRRRLRRPSAFTRNHVYAYDAVVERALASLNPGFLRYPCVMPGWDNTARRSEGGARIVVGSSPDAYGSWLYETLTRFDPPARDQDLVFVNAWNEWAEGAYLEPDRLHGHGYLRAHRAAVDRAATPQGNRLRTAVDD